MGHFYVRDHVKSLSFFSFKLLLFELNLMAGAEGHLFEASHLKSPVMLFILLLYLFNKEKHHLMGQQYENGQDDMLSHSTIKKLLACL